MTNPDLEFDLIDAYYGLLKNLEPDRKLELISRLSESMKTRKAEPSPDISSLFGAFIPEKSAEELIEEIKKSRNFDRKRATL